MEVKKSLETELVVLRQKNIYSEKYHQIAEDKLKIISEEHDKKMKILKEEKDAEMKESLQKVMDDKTYIDNKYQKLKVEHKESEEKLKKSLIMATS